MKERKIEIEEGKLTGFFDKDTVFQGDLSFKGSFRIDGNFKGKINSDSMLMVGETGKIEADIKVGYIIINGEVKGGVQALQKVEVRNRGKVIGTITTPKLIVEDGAHLEVTCQTTEKGKALGSGE